MHIYIPRFCQTEKAFREYTRVEQDLYGCNGVGARMELADVDVNGNTGLFEQKVNTDSRTVSGTANVFEVSRTQLLLHIDGIELEAFHQNPVVLAAHQQATMDLMPGAIGTVEKMFKAEKGQKLKFRNMKFDQDALAEAWFQKVIAGTVRMVSVGFIPIEENFKVETIGKGAKKREMIVWEVISSELVELSLIPIGANRGAFLGQAARMSSIEEQLVKLQQTFDSLVADSRQADSRERLERLDNVLRQFG